MKLLMRDQLQIEIDTVCTQLHQMAQNDDEHITRRIIIVCNMLTTRVRCCLANEFVITCCQPTVQPLTSTFSVYSHSLSPFSLLGEKVNGQWRRHETAADEIAPLWVRRSSQPLSRRRGRSFVFFLHTRLYRERERGLWRAIIFQ